MPIFLPNDGYFRSETKTTKQLVFFSKKKTSKRSVSPVGCTFEKIWQKIHAKSPILSLNDQKLEQSFFIPKKRPKIVPLNTLKIVLTILRVFFL